MLYRARIISYLIAYLSYILFAIIVVAYSFFIYAGHEGSNSIVFLGLAVANGILAPRKFKNLIFALMLIIVLGMNYLTYNYPEYLNPMNSIDKFYDMLFTVIFLMIMLHFYMKNIWNQYTVEKKQVEYEKDVIRDQNKKINKQLNELKLASDTKDKLNSIIAHDLKGTISALKDLSDYMPLDYNDFSNE